MKKLACLLALVLLPLLIRADDWLANGDFSDGISHWYGEAKAPADFAPPDPFTKADPLTSQGMIVPLSGGVWKKVSQDFKGKSANGILTVSYVLSPDLAFSKRPDDYQNMPDKIGYDHWVAFNTPPDSWVIFVSELEQEKGAYYVIQPEIGSTKEQTFTASLKDMTPWSPKTICLAFPPGAGTIVLHKVEISDP